jgi:hypothetical protein
MQSKSLILKATLLIGALAALESGIALAAPPTGGSAAAGVAVLTVADEGQLNDSVRANDIDHGAQDNTDNGAQHDDANDANTGAHDGADGTQDTVQGHQG